MVVTEWRHTCEAADAVRSPTVFRAKTSSLICASPQWIAAAQRSAAPSESASPWRDASMDERPASAAIPFSP
jgi:hypothetical protein